MIGLWRASHRTHAIQALHRPFTDNPVKNRLGSRRWPKRVCIAAAAIPFAFSTALFADWQYDNSVIRRQAAEITANLSQDSARIVAVNHWVYNHQGFGKNSSYFLFPALGPTPIQVLERGGDCSDKSRLVAAMLNELGIDAGLVMISPCPHCGFIHSVVEARYQGGSMVVDPIWNIDYPAGDGRYFGVRDLAWRNRGVERVVELQRQRGEMDKIANMPATEARFEYAVAMNWDKNAVTQTAAETMRLLGYQPEIMFRPRLLEDPKLALSWFLMIVAMAATAASVLFYGVYRALVQKGGRDDRNPREIAMS
jgi:hypothetical protein